MSWQPARVGIIGGNGWLGRAMASAMLSSGKVRAEQLWLSARTLPAQPQVDGQAVYWTTDNAHLLAHCDAVILALRPQDFLALSLRAENTLLISVMAAISTAELSARTACKTVVRCMPNAAIAIRRSYSPWRATAEVSTEQKGWVQELLSCWGTEDELEEEAHFDYLTGLCGSGPAFPALLGRAMCEHALSRGLPEHVVNRAVEGVLTGASGLLGGQNERPAEVVQRFLDYRGTTAAALITMIHEGFEQAIHHGLQAAEQAAFNMHPEEMNSRTPDSVPEGAPRTPGDS
ncbi:pyrroline-5-carboxylate reductase dimerization domain-containing protein [Pokkaliibacter sp. MBI-7]|uniref:pyrroline-5-carboxylate reductase family protein n=1 Tax=Pokkaliibacter sp. MBI-7 TaxID=3040600 RepID=UPI00244B1D0E|nr:pyrroline-5-carboxylate reductase dimerization domain-containing protein [Pokkaliibacter sp. MBI-7]MDH2433684.1 pyrroline-5-carboxylate reductase dimerization domain-containing protein [Pokkaliibacter sp. MBI-7]